MASGETGLRCTQVASAIDAIRLRLAVRGAGERVVITDKDFSLETHDLVDHARFHTESSLEIVNRISGKDKIAMVRAQAREIYECYPRKRDVGAATRAILRAMSDSDIPTATADRPLFLAVAASAYAEWCKLEKKEATFIPYPATWFARKSYLNATEMVLTIMKSTDQKLNNPSLKERAGKAILCAQQKNAAFLRKGGSNSSASGTSGWSQPISSSD